MGVKPKLVIATKNPGKLAEFEYLLPEFDLIPLPAGFPDTIEDKDTYAANAHKKAWEAYLYFDREYPVLADDSGIEVEALKSFPGVHSRRWFPGSDEERNKMLLRLMYGEAFTDARQVCHLVCYHWEKTFGGVGEVAGRIYGSPQSFPNGNNGFGYDSIFYLKTADGRTGKALAQLTPGERAFVSHRARAVHLFREWYKKEIGGI